MKRKESKRKSWIESEEEKGREKREGEGEVHRRGGRIESLLLVRVVVGVSSRVRRVSRVVAEPERGKRRDEGRESVRERETTSDASRPSHFRQRRPATHIEFLKGLLTPLATLNRFPPPGEVMAGEALGVAPNPRPRSFWPNSNRGVPPFA